MSDADKLTPNDSDKTVNMNIGDVNINANVNGDVNLTIKKSRPKPIPIENQITPNHRHAWKELYERIVDLGLVIGEYRDKNKGYGAIQKRLNDYLKVPSIHYVTDDRFKDGLDFLQKRLFAFLTNDKVIKNPPPWWRDYLLAGIHANCKVNDEQYRDYLKQYRVNSAKDLNNKDLAKLYHARNGTFDVSRLRPNPRDFVLRINSFSRWLDEMEQAGDFDRMSIRMTKEQIHETLKKYEPTLWQIAYSTFMSFWTQAKKELKFESKPGVRPKASR